MKSSETSQLLEWTDPWLTRSCLYLVNGVSAAEFVHLLIIFTKNCASHFTFTTFQGQHWPHSKPVCCVLLTSKMGALHTNCWLKSYFLAFLHLFPSQTEKTSEKAQKTRKRGLPAFRCYSQMLVDTQKLADAKIKCLETGFKPVWLSV